MVLHKDTSVDVGGASDGFGAGEETPAWLQAVTLLSADKEEDEEEEDAGMQLSTVVFGAFLAGITRRAGPTARDPQRTWWLAPWLESSPMR